MAEAVVVLTHADAGPTGLAEQRKDHLDADAGLVSQQQYDAFGRLVDLGQCAADRGGAAGLEVGIEGDVETGQVNALPDLRCGAPERDHHLGQSGRACGAERGRKQRAAVVLQQLLGPAQPP